MSISVELESDNCLLSLTWVKSHAVLTEQLALLECVGLTEEVLVTLQFLDEGFSSGVGLAGLSRACEELDCLRLVAHDELEGFSM